ncbi:MAG TPA: class I SAM-dependent methyltransferase [Caldilineaceae bacterium]|nr:class I SAM-dependent methyltransferase [Caldilineaceae bacterium]
MGTAKIQGELWGQAPEDWAALGEPVGRPLWEAMLTEAAVGAGTRMLDAGCGGGGASLLAAERGAQVSGIDAAAGLITVARRRVPGGDFRVGDIEELPYEDDSFDVVFAASSLQYTADRVATLRGFGRVCRPGGRIVAGLFGPPDKVTFRAILGAVRDALPEPPPGAGPFELSMPGKLESLFMEAGLTLLKSGEVNCPFRFPDFETFWRGNSASGPMQGAMRLIGREKLKSVLWEATAAFRVNGGPIHIEPNIFRYVVATP